jgi:hypothetical protein
MVHKIVQQKEPAWKTSLRDVADNPDWIFDNMDAMKKELNHDNPDMSYLREKYRHIGEWLDEIEKVMPHKFKSQISFAVNGKSVSAQKFREAVETVKGMHYEGEYELNDAGKMVRKRR